MSFALSRTASTATLEAYVVFVRMAIILLMESVFSNALRIVLTAITTLELASNVPQDLAYNPRLINVSCVTLLTVPAAVPITPAVNVTLPLPWPLMAVVLVHLVPFSLIITLNAAAALEIPSTFNPDHQANAILIATSLIVSAARTHQSA